jgi:putative transposase
MESTEVLAMVGGHVDEELLLRNEYLAAENEILKSKLNGRIRFTDPERIRLAKVSKRLGRKGLRGVPCIVKPDTLLRWHRELVSKKFDGSKRRRYPGRPKVSPQVEQLVVQLANENLTWGYDRIQGALANLGHTISDQTVCNILKRNGIPPAPQRGKNTTWTDFIRAHKDSIAAMDFFTVEVITPEGLSTIYVLTLICLANRKVHIAGFTKHPNEKWMTQIDRNLTMADCGVLNGISYLIHDRDTKFCSSFDQVLRWSGITPTKLPPRSPNLNAFVERLVRSIKEECLSKLLLFGEEALKKALSEYVHHYHKERNHQGVENRLLFPEIQPTSKGSVERKQRMGGLLNFYYRKAS